MNPEKSQSNQNPKRNQEEKMESKEICISDQATYQKYFLGSQSFHQMHIFICTCQIKSFKPAAEQFSNLKILSLDNNKIESIQNLTTLKMPHLQKLLLFKNFISSLRPLAKMIFLDNLAELSLSMNYLREVPQVLMLCELSSLKELRVYNNNIDPGSTKGCAKMNSFFIKELGFEMQLDYGRVLKRKLLPQLFRNCTQQ